MAVEQPLPIGGPSRYRREKPDERELGLCVHCGFCLNACPTYLELGVEMDSPRGRIALMRALDAGRIEWNDRVQKHFDQCLQCRACETACPSKVPYGRLMEATRAGAFEQKKWPLRQRILWRLIMRGVFPYPKRLRLAFLGLQAYQRSGLQALVRRTGLFQRLLPGLAEVEALSPDARAPFFSPDDAKRYAPRGAPRTTAALLTGCVMPLTFPGTHHATARVLSRNGVRVTAPADQLCCGALHAHGGDVEEALRLARTNIDRFLRDEPDAIVVNAAGCGSHMKEYGHLLRDDSRYAEKAERFSSLVRDVHEYLTEIGFEPPAGELSRSVTYQDSCHLVHAQGVRDAPRDVLRSIPGLQLKEMAHPDRCCGSAGIYSILQRRISRDLLRGKMEEVLASGATQICTANPGCMVQLDAGLRLFDSEGAMAPRSVHAIDLLDESYRRAEGDGYADAGSAGQGAG